MTKSVDNRVSVRLDDEAAENLHMLMEQTGLNKSEVINECLKSNEKVWIFDCRKLASELQELRLMLKKGLYDERVKCSVLEVCKKLEKEICRVFWLEEGVYGDHKTNQ